MGVLMAWTSHPLQIDDVARLEGPWEEVRIVAPSLLLIESNERLSPVYHSLKWALPEGAALIVTPVTERPKSKGMAPGTTTWLRDRIR